MLSWGFLRMRYGFEGFRKGVDVVLGFPEKQGRAKEFFGRMNTSKGFRKDDDAVRALDKG